MGKYDREKWRVKIITIIMICIWIVSMIFILSYTKNENELNKVVTSIEERTVVSGEYLNIDGFDYIVLQVKYEGHSKIERYSTEELLLIDNLENEETYLKEHFNRNGDVIKRELYYSNK